MKLSFAATRTTLATCAAALIASVVIGTSAGNAATIFTGSDGATDFYGAYRGVDDPYTASFGSAFGMGAISFELFGANSVDGDNTYKDVFTVALNGINVFSGSFSMSGGGANVITTNTLGWAWNTVTNPGGDFQGGVTYISGLAALMTSGSNTFSVSFTQPGPANGSGQNAGDESWALNNLTVAAVPVPAAGFMLLAGLGGLAALRRRKTAPAV